MDSSESQPPPPPLGPSQGAGNDNDQTNESGETTTTPPPTPPSAPTKVRRRRPLLARLRSRRRQLLQQHAERANNDDNDKTPQNRRRPNSLVENYYRVDTMVHSPLSSTPSNASIVHASDGSTVVAKSSETTATTSKRVKVILPGVPRYEEDWARDSHDFFNLIVLIPVTVLNIMNWNWDLLWSKLSSSPLTVSSALAAVQSAWTGDWFDLFFGVTAGYFIIDLMWILIVPVCVKSPSVILQHHVAVLLFILIPYHHVAVRYCMGACMTVEVNTWFLIARRVFNKQGFPPWTVFNSSWLSIRVKVISIFFYLTWISIRCLLYPALLVPFYQHWRDWSHQTGTYFNILLPSVPLHAAFCLLNLKWSYELLMSKLRYFRRQRHYYYQQQQRRLYGNGSNGVATIAGQPQPQQQLHRRTLSFPDQSVSSGL